MLELIRMSSNMADKNQQNHLLPIFATKRVDLLLEELISIKVILFVIPEKSHFFNLDDSSLGRHVNTASPKSLEIQAYSITKPRTLLKRKFVWN